MKDRNGDSAGEGGGWKKGKKGKKKKQKMSSSTTPTSMKDCNADSPGEWGGNTGKKKKEKMMDEIDEIFERKKKNKREAEKEAKGNSVVIGVAPPAAATTRVGRAKKEEPVHPQANPKRRRTTTEGLSIYTEEELGVGIRDSGGTPLCPYDCQCCF